MAIRISGVKWRETVEVTKAGNGVKLQVMTKSGRLFRSTSFRLTKKEALRLATELVRAANRR